MEPEDSGQYMVMMLGLDCKVAAELDEVEEYCVSHSFHNRHYLYLEMMDMVVDWHKHLVVLRDMVMNYSIL